MTTPNSEAMKRWRARHPEAVAALAKRNNRIVARATTLLRATYPTLWKELRAQAKQELTEEGKL